MRLVILNDGETFTDFDGCEVWDIPDHIFDPINDLRGDDVHVLKELMDADILDSAVATGEGTVGNVSLPLRCFTLKPGKRAEMDAFLTSE